MTLSVFKLVRDWWARPSTRDRILAALLDAEASANLPGIGLQGLMLRKHAKVGGRIYSVLYRLEEEGLVHRTEGLPARSRGDLPRYYYALTERGREAASAQASAASQ
jgi:hypothetical protein